MHVLPRVRSPAALYSTPAIVPPFPIHHPTLHGYSSQNVYALSYVSPLLSRLALYRQLSARFPIDVEPNSQVEILFIHRRLAVRAVLLAVSSVHFTAGSTEHSFPRIQEAKKTFNNSSWLWMCIFGPRRYHQTKTTQLHSWSSGVG